MTNRNAGNYRQLGDAKLPSPLPGPRYFQRGPGPLNPLHEGMHVGVIHHQNPQEIDYAG
jgi:hypothetical protein